MTDEAYMNLALDEASKAFDLGEVPIGAVLVDEKGSVISRTHNLTETLQSVSGHAEMLAIQKASGELNKWRLTGFSLYTTVEPCVMCAGAIVLSRISRVVFGCWDEKFGGSGSIFNILEEKKLNHQVIVQGGLFEEKAKFLMQSFFREIRQKKRAIVENNL